MNNVIRKLIGRRTLGAEVQDQLRDANTRLFKARCCLAAAEAAVNGLFQKKLVIDAAIESKQVGPFKNELFDTQLKILEAENAVDFAKSEVIYQSNRVARLSNYFKDVAK